jgi:predicted nucleic acid-binding protein
MSYLLDTNVVSELRKGARCDAGVTAWLAGAQDDELFLSVLVVGELERGIEQVRRRDPDAAAALGRWLRQITRAYGDRILPITLPIARLWGRLGAPDPVPTLDGLLAATALHHDLVLVTRNVKDMARTGAQLLNPFA